MWQNQVLGHGMCYFSSYFIGQSKQNGWCLKSVRQEEWSEVTWPILMSLGYGGRICLSWVTWPPGSSPYLEGEKDGPATEASEGRRRNDKLCIYDQEMWLLSCGADWRQTGLLHFWEDCIVALSMMPQVWLRKTCGGLTLTPQATVDLQIGHQLFATFLEHLLSYTYFIYG